MASVWIEKLKSGRWKCQWREPDGSKPSQSYDSRGEAMRAKREQEVKLGPTLRGMARRLGARPATHLTIAQIAARWRETREGSPMGKRPGADRYMREAVRDVVKLSADLGWTYSRDANAHDIADLKRRRKNIGVARPLGVLRAVLRWAAENQSQPLDHAANVAMRAPQSRKASVPLLTDEQAEFVLQRARELQVEALFSCLMVYGWRPITACRLKIADVDLDAGLVRLAIKQNGEPWEHPLFPFHVEMLRPLLKDWAGKSRPTTDPLFLSPSTAEAWTSGTIGGFYRRNIRPAEARAGNIYALKRLAITRMGSGASPWDGRLEIADVQLFTGHKTKEQVLRYLATNLSRARGLVSRGADRGAPAAEKRQEAPSLAGSPES